MISSQNNNFNPNSNSGSRKPIVGITMGDAAGIGPEITLKAISDEKIAEVCVPVVIGDAEFLTKIALETGFQKDFVTVKRGQAIPIVNGQIIIYDLANLREKFIVGEESAIAGKASAEYIETAVGLCQQRQIDAITTAPISKKSIHLGGYDFPGHTEMLGYLTNTTDFRMAFFAERLRVLLLSTHISLTQAIAFVKKDNLVDLIRFTDRELSKLLGRKVKIAVAGLNPHASEDGLFGDEEAREINPAIEDCRKFFGIDVSGAYSPDTIFIRAYRGEFDAVVSCYHDQATIAVKCLSFGESVNVTLGLPIIRTSVDHGTAFDIAGKGIAESSSMKAAIKLAAELARAKFSDNA